MCDDLFEDLDALPIDVKHAVMDWYENTEEGDMDPYEACRLLEKTLLPLGYTFEVGLNGVPYGLKKQSETVVQ